MTISLDNSFWGIYLAKKVIKILENTVKNPVTTINLQSTKPRLLKLLLIFLLPKVQYKLRIKLKTLAVPKEIAWAIPTFRNLGGKTLSKICHSDISKTVFQTPIPTNFIN